MGNLGVAMNAPATVPRKISRPARCPAYATAAARWRAVVAKDARADGLFCYSVATTGIYCRPSCPARAALRGNVAFHQTAAEAERAGFRACKRCRPKGPTLAQEQRAAVAAACRVITNSESAPSLAVLAGASGMSATHFHRVFKAATGVTPKAYALGERARRFRAELPIRASVTEAIYEAGFHSSGRCYEKSTQALGMTPSRFREGGRGVVIRFAVGKCSLGAVLVAAAEKGVCAILLGDDPERLVRDLQDRFARAELIGGDAAFERTVARVIGLIEAPRLGWDLPLEVRGTVFQMRVWEALRTVPPGTTVTYSELAQRIGRPRAVRAVASACAANEIAVAIPCHRVVRVGGGLSGYRWGIARKRALLDREAADG